MSQKVRLVSIPSGSQSSKVPLPPNFLDSHNNIHHSTLELRRSTQTQFIPIIALCELRYYSRSLDKQTSANVILPQIDKPGPYPVLYLLHGLSDDHSIWARRSNVERYCEGLPLIVVMPDGGRGFYTDAIEGFAYESAIIRDLIPFIDNTFHTKANREGRCIGGLSMGGYGAIRFALRYPELFCSAHSHSGAFRYWEARAESPEFQRIFGKNPKGSENDIFALASKLAGSALPKLRIDCGVNDFLFESNQEFHAHLNQLNIPHEYEEFPGEHNWAYWDAHISQALAFHAKNLGIC